MSSASTVCSRINLSSMSSLVRNGSSMVSVLISDNSAETFFPSPYAHCATAACALMQNSDWFVFATNAAINSRSGSVKKLVTCGGS